MGDPACWLQSTCFECGRVLEPDEVEQDRCPHCGAQRPPSTGAPDRPGD